MGAVTHGMNPEEVEALGVELRRMGDELDRIAGRLDGRVRSTRWVGSTGSRFKNDWWPKHRASVRAAANDLRGFGDAARNNAREQRGVSQTGTSGWGSGGGVTATDVFARLRPFGTVIGNFDDKVSGPLGTLFSSLGGLKNVNTGATLLHHGGTFSGLGTGIGYFSAGVTAYQGLDALSQHHYMDAGFAGGDLAASGLKGSHVPHAYLFGVTAQTWLEAGKAARLVDWSPEGLRLVADATPSDWGNAIGEAVTQELPSRLVKIFGL